MMRFLRESLLQHFCAMISRGEPIIGGGAGTGLSAKCEEAAGIDLIVIYNSGRYRMAGRGSLAGLLAYGNANEIVKDLGREVLPVVRHTPAATTSFNASLRVSDFFVSDVLLNIRCFLICPWSMLNSPHGGPRKSAWSRKRR